MTLLMREREKFNEGKAEKERSIILNMHKKGFSLELIANAIDKSIDEIESIIADNLAQ